MNLLLLFVLSLVQNAAFTWVSRSRNSADVRHHALAATLSNSVWFVTNFVILTTIWPALTEGDVRTLVISGIVYVAGTTIGSVAAMARLLRTEDGKRRVGARK